MNVNNTLTRADYVQQLTQAEIELLIDASIQHTAIPLIAGISMEEATPEQLKKSGFKGPKPEPLSPAVKNELYKRFYGVLKPVIAAKAAEYVQSKLAFLTQMSDEQIREKALQGGQKLPLTDWKMRHELYYFHEARKISILGINGVPFHEICCPILSSYRDSGKLFQDAKIDEVI